MGLLSNWANKISSAFRPRRPKIATATPRAQSLASSFASRRPQSAAVQNWRRTATASRPGLGSSFSNWSRKLRTNQAPRIATVTKRGQALAQQFAIQQPQSAAVQSWKRTSGRIGGITATAQGAQARPGTMARVALSSLGDALTFGKKPKIAQSTPEAEALAFQYGLENPFSPAVQNWARTQKPGAIADYTRRELQSNALLNQLLAQKQALAGVQQFWPRKYGETAGGIPKLYQPDRPFATIDEFKENLAQKFPNIFGESGEVRPEAQAAGTEAYWKPQQEIFGGSETGSSLMNTIQNWMQKREGQAPGQAPGQQPGQAAAQGFQPFFKPGAVQAKSQKEETGVPAYAQPPQPGQENKMWWEGGTLQGPPTPEQFNTPEYVEGYMNVLINPDLKPDLYDNNGRLNDEGMSAITNAWDLFTADAAEGYLTPDKISANEPLHEQFNMNMLLRDRYDQNWFESMQDTGLSTVVNQVASLDPSKLPAEISQERLDAMQRGPDFATLYDMGYRSKAYQDEASQIIQNAQEFLEGSDAQIIYDPAELDSLTYANIEALKQDIAQTSPADWQRIAEDGGQINLRTEFYEFNERGEAINRAWWEVDYPPQSEMSKSEKELYMDRQRFYYEWYWSDESIEQRRKEREESYQYYHEKDLEGWGDYYDLLETMKLYGEQNDYWSAPGKFEELRRKWETTGGDLSWEDWLKQFDFEGEWASLTPEERGERKYIYSPRMQRLNY